MRLRRPLGATAINPLFIFSARGARLEGGNHGVQKCDSVDSLGLVIKCLGGGGARAGGLDSLGIQQKAPFPWRPSQHTFDAAPHRGSGEGGGDAVPLRF